MEKVAGANQSDELRWSRISVRGPQSESFLQGQLTQDLALVDDPGRWSLLLRPDSALLSTCFVRRVPEGFDVDVPREMGEVALARLRRFHLRVDCSLDLSDVEGGPMLTTAELIDGRWPGAAEFGVELTPQSYGAAFVERTVSFTKGCYTGQELVARLDARKSSVPWRFVWASGPQVERINEALRSKGPEGPQGITTALERDGRIVAVGFAHRSLLGSDVLASFHDVTVEAIG
ncbi:MAG: hypothetical protein WA786_07560 [Acidimicrobiales bacterium]